MSLSLREQAEAIEQFGDDLLELTNAFSAGFDNAVVDRVCTVPDQDRLETIAKGFQKLGALILDECDQAEEAEDRRRANPLEPDHRRLDQ